MKEQTKSKLFGLSFTEYAVWLLFSCFFRMYSSFFINWCLFVYLSVSNQPFLLLYTRFWYHSFALLHFFFFVQTQALAFPYDTMCKAIYFTRADDDRTAHHIVCFCVGKIIETLYICLWISVSVVYSLSLYTYFMLAIALMCDCCLICTAGDACQRRIV